MWTEEKVDFRKMEINQPAFGQYQSNAVQPHGRLHTAINAGTFS